MTTPFPPIVNRMLRARSQHIHAKAALLERPPRSNAELLPLGFTLSPDDWREFTAWPDVRYLGDIDSTTLQPNGLAGVPARMDPHVVRSYMLTRYETTEAI